MSRISRGSLRKAKGIAGVDALCFGDESRCFRFPRLVDEGVLVGAIAFEGFICCAILELRRMVDTTTAIARAIIKSY